MTQANLNADFWVEVKHRRPLPKRYTWEIHRKGLCLSVKESRLSLTLSLSDFGI